MRVMMAIGPVHRKRWGESAHEYVEMTGSPEVNRGLVLRFVGQHWLDERAAMDFEMVTEGTEVVVSGILRVGGLPVIEEMIYAITGIAQRRGDG